MDKVATHEQTGAQSIETQKFTFEEAYEATKEYFFGNDLSANVWCDKYAMRDKEGLFLEKTPDAMHDRLAAEFARIDSEKYGFNYNERFTLYRDAVDRFGRIVPQGSPMAAVGNTQQVMSASNCVVVEPPEDSIAGIMKTGAELAQLYKRRCGVGSDLSGLRPDGFHVNNAARTTSGAWSFADYYSYITRMIGQCLHEDTRVLTRRGFKEIKFVSVNDEVWTKKGWVTVNGVVENRKPCVKVTTEFGNRIVCSKDHVFHTIKGEKAIKDLAVGDPITQIVVEGEILGGIERLGDNEYLYHDTIVSISPYEEGKEHTVYDLILAEEHLFWANGLYAHNSGRRGALMLTLNVHHPDVEKFATMKADLKKVTGANVSIRLSDEFLHAVEDETTYEQRWPCEDDAEPIWTKQVDAKQVWNTIIETATATAEPGLMFWDRCTKRLPAHSYPQFKSKSSNPCSEIILSSYDSCRLISLNLTGFVRDAFTKKAKFDLESFKSDVRLAMQMIDNLIDIELELIEKIQAVCSTNDERELWQKLWQAGHDGRRTGLGTHGLGDMLAQIGIKYDSQEALDFADKLYEALRDTSYTTSIDLAEIRGPFPAFDWDTEKDNEYIRDLPESIRKRMAKVGRRNISILTQAPTGSVSIVSKVGEFNRYNVSSGVEPVFRNNFTRRKKINAGDIHTRVDYTDDLGDNWQNFEVYHSNILNFFEKMRGTVIDDLTDSDTQEELAELIKELPEQFVTSDQVDWKFRVDLQGKEQFWIDHSISSTINLPKGTTSDVVGGIYLAGWRSGLKGVTVYVDGSRDGVLITKEDDRIDPSVRPKKIIRLQSPKRPKELPCDIHQHTVRGEKWTALVGLLDGEPYEMFGGYSNAIHLPKKYTTGILKRRARGKYDLIIPVGDDELVIKDVVGTFNDDEIGWTTRLMSTSLRHGAPIEFLVEQLSKSGIQSFSRVLARVLKKYIPDGEQVKTNIACGNSCESPDLIYAEGCVSCSGCGWTKCS